MIYYKVSPHDTVARLSRFLRAIRQEGDHRRVGLFGVRGSCCDSDNGGTVGALRTDGGLVAGCDLVCVLYSAAVAVSVATSEMRYARCWLRHDYESFGGCHCGHGHTMLRTRRHIAAAVHARSKRSLDGLAHAVGAGKLESSDRRQEPKHRREGKDGNSKITIIAQVVYEIICEEVIIEGEILSLLALAASCLICKNDCSSH
mmetsp:Transcript_2375/g.6570  ORF Transcript_2375/g.6570 Transcript_2375/m.6570 type:complete len:202 (+) Transcript_2375:625-1230(+)